MRPTYTELNPDPTDSTEPTTETPDRITEEVLPDRWRITRAPRGADEECLQIDYDPNGTLDTDAAESTINVHTNALPEVEAPYRVLALDLNAGKAPMGYRLPVVLDETFDSHEDVVECVLELADELPHPATRMDNALSEVEMTVAALERDYDTVESVTHDVDDGVIRLTLPLLAIHEEMPGADDGFDTERYPADIDNVSIMARTNQGRTPTAPEHLIDIVLSLA